MLYVYQSLGEDEKIVHVGRFHVVYRFQAIAWCFVGLAAMWFILQTAYHYDITQTIKTIYPNLPASAQDQAWAQIVSAKGGPWDVIMNLHWGVKLGAVGAFLIGILLCIRMLVIEMVTEIAVTNSRLIYKTGLVSRYVGEISVDRIEGVNVIQGVLGRIFGYGRLIIRGMGVGEVVLPPIQEPIKFRRAIDKAKTL